MIHSCSASENVGRVFFGKVDRHGGRFFPTRWQVFSVQVAISRRFMHFHADAVYVPLGTYETLTGTVARIDPAYREIDIRTGTTTALEKSPPITISFDDLVQVTGEGIVGVDDYLGLEEYSDED